MVGSKINVYGVVLFSVEHAIFLIAICKVGGRDFEWFTIF